MKKLLHFPHIIRRITVSLTFIKFKYFFGLFFFLLLLPNLWQNRIYPPSEEKNLRFAIIKNPTLSSLHEKLGQYYLSINEEEAKKEYLLAEEFYKEQNLSTGDPKVLGNLSSPWQTWKNIKEQKQILYKSYTYWEEVLKKFPDYQYALLKLAAINLQLGNKDNAVAQLQKLLKQSPNNKEALELLAK